jgi:hypothetical protein
MLFRAVSGSIMNCCEKEGFIPGITAVLHTFGGPLDFHPHIHVLLTLGGSENNENFDFNVWRDCSFFPEKALKSEFKRLLLRDLRGAAAEKILKIPRCIKLKWWKKLKTMNFYEVTQKLWSIIWYVYIGEKLDNAVYTAKYIGRYAKRPCISEAKIDYYSHEEQIVKFTYRDKLSGEYVQATVSVEEFIGRLIRHIPESNFRMIRYYGIYANAVKNKLLPVILYQISKLYGLARLAFSPDEQARNWRERIIRSTGNDPLACPKCKELMALAEICYRARDGTLKTVPVFN